MSTAAKLKKPPSFVAKVEAGERQLDVLESIAVVRDIGIDELELMRHVAEALPKRIELWAPARRA